jgi:endonuclease III
MKYKKTLKIFQKHYKLVPLEVFGSDPYKTLISTVMSARTNDDTTLAASYRLFKKAPNISSLSRLSEQQIRKLIYPVGFYKTKARHLRELAIMLNQNGGKIPNTKEELMKLPGVGRKTANLVLNRAFSVPAIAVDTHVHRITNLLKWVDTKTPLQTERELTYLVPKELWTDINRLFVSIGRQFRSPQKLKEFLEREGLL